VGKKAKIPCQPNIISANNLQLIIFPFSDYGNLESVKLTYEIGEDIYIKELKLACEISGEICIKVLKLPNEMSEEIDTKKQKLPNEISEELDTKELCPAPLLPYLPNDPDFRYR